MAINLLPQEQFGPKDKFYKLAVRLKVFDYILLSIFVSTILFGGLYLYYLTGVASDHLTKQTDLKTQIKNLESSEQNLVLIQDRLKKISPIIKNDFAQKDLNTLSQLTSSDNTTVKLVDGKVQKKGVEVTFLISDSAAMGSFLNLLTQEKTYQQIVINNINFRPEAGYYLTLKLTQ